MTGIVTVSVSAKNKRGLAIIGPIIGIREIISSPPLINLQLFLTTVRRTAICFASLNIALILRINQDDAEYTLTTEKL